MDIVTYTGTGTSTADNVIPHSLAAVPAVIITKNLSQGSNWGVFHKDLTRRFSGLNLDNANAQRTDGSNAFLSETSTTFTLGQNGTVNDQGSEFVAYLFADTPSLIHSAVAIQVMVTIH